MKIEIEIVRSVVVMNSSGSDYVILFTTLPSTMPKMRDGDAAFSTHAEAGTGVQWVKDNVGDVPLEVVEKSRL